MSMFNTATIRLFIAFLTVFSLSTVSASNTESELTNTQWYQPKPKSLDQQTVQKLIAGDGAAENRFGEAVALDGSWLAVSAPYHQSGSIRGAVYLYQYSTARSQWVFYQKITAPNPTSRTFGETLALDGKLLVVGARGANIDGKAFRGAAYVYGLNGNDWMLSRRVDPADGGNAGDQFGSSLALDDGRLAVGAPLANISGLLNQGTVYVFDYSRATATWQQKAKLVASDGKANDNFGKSVSLDGDRIAVGAPYVDTPSIEDQGAAYIFDYMSSPSPRPAKFWSQRKKLTPSTGVGTNAHFGRYVALDGGRAVISSTPRNIFVFERGTGDWSQEISLIADSGLKKVSLEGDLIAVGSVSSNIEKWGSVRGVPVNLGNVQNGSVYLFKRSGSNWQLSQQLPERSSDVAAGNQFGGAVALDGGRLAVGASGVAIDGNVKQGAAYVYKKRVYSIGGTISGLGSGKTVVLQNNGGDDWTVNDSVASFVFPTSLIDGSSYAVSVATQPDGQTCTLNNESGTISGSDITNVSVACTNNVAPPPASYNVSGNVSGLGSGKTLVLRNNGGDDTTINANGRFTFATAVADSAAYAVSIATQPDGQTCTINNNSGTISGSDVTNIAVTCADNPPPPPPPPASSYSVGGNVSGLGSGKTLILRNNSGDDATINTNGGFTFATTIADNAAYAVSIARQPEGQTCTINNNSGTISGANVTNVAVACTDNTVPETAKIFNGLSGSWYDPTYNGSGFNLIQTSGGFLMYFYGYKGSADGDSQWLLSEIISDPVHKGQTLTTNVFSGFTGNGGNFTTKPTSPRSGLTDWGQAQITINSCSAGVIKLTGNDGTITHNIVPLAPIDGLTCTETETNTISYSAPSTPAGIVGGFSGSWYDPAYNGSGFNLVQTTGGLLIYFYGYKGSANGDAQWLLSEVISDPIRKGETLTTNVFSGFTGNGGDFTTKPTTPRSGLTDWGQAQITINSCAAGVIQLTGDDGTITHNIVPLAMINGVNCTE